VAEMQIRGTQVKDGVIKPDGSIAFTADQSLGGNRITNLATPSGPADAATKAYVDAGGGGAGAALTRIQQIITAASQATVDFTGISAAYSALIVHFQTRDTGAGTSSFVMRVRVNNDSTAANYTSAAYTGVQNGAAANSTIAASTSGVFCMGNPADGNTAGIVGQGVLEIINYAGTTFHKRITSHGGYEDGTVNLSTLSISSRWKSTAAINRLTFLTDGTAFKDGSVFTLYGVS
jgi:hypothetical protein